MKIICLYKIKICQLNVVLSIWISFSIFHWSICWVGERKESSGNIKHRIQDNSF